jgi:predicted acylesterase/phospholipase RssA
MKVGAATRPEPLNPHHAPPPDRYCDMVLKGGVVDGVVYPWAIMELARAYRFKNISGTSVGAVAAALTAAAEYSRRFGSVAGFNEVLLKVPEELAEPVGADTRLYSLFQPSRRGGQRLFTLFVALFGKGDKLRGLRQAYGWTALAGFLIGLAVPLATGALVDWRAVWSSCTGCAVVGLGIALQLIADGVFGAIVLMLVVLTFDLLALAKDNFGLCSGKRVDPTTKGSVAFTDWLHEGIQGAAGRPLDQPLTFQHLWNAPGGAGAATVPSARPTRKPRSIDLRMISTSLTHGRPYGLPLPDDSPQLFFKLDEWRDYFPDEVIAYLRVHAPVFVPKAGDPVCEDFRELPRGDLPVLVATRMSLSFPVLFKAVPLYAIHNEKPPRGPVMRRCWFADGGICSNFMIHQFDAVVPNWPTFGIALESARDPRKTAEPKSGMGLTAASRAAKARLAAKAAEDATSASVVVTQYHDEGREEVWNLFDPGPGIPWDGPPPRKLALLTGFVGSLLDAAKDWNDNTSMRMSGTRDRIARIKLGGGTDSPMGGLNLRLPGKDIMKMAREYGWVAGQKLVDKFAPERAAAHPGAVPSPGWNEHRWVRFQSFVFGLRERVGGFEAAAEQSGYCLPLSQQIDAAGEEPPLQGPGARKLTPAQVSALKATHAALIKLEESFAEIRTVQPYKPVPPPEMRLRMPL